MTAFGCLWPTRDHAVRGDFEVRPPVLLAHQLATVDRIAEGGGWLPYPSSHETSARERAVLGPPVTPALYTTGTPREPFAGAVSPLLREGGRS